MDTQRYGWSLPIGRLFGIQIRLHLLFVIYILAKLFEAWSTSFFKMKVEAGFLALLFGSVLLHELGHCFFARRMGGSAESILLWPLGGLARIDVPRMWRRELWSYLGGPLVNFLIAGVSAAALWFQVRGFLPVHLIFAFDFWQVAVPGMSYSAVLGAFALKYLVVQNEVLLLFNLLPVFPLDGGGIMRALLWKRLGFGQATLLAVRIGKIGAVAMAIYGLVQGDIWIVMIAIYCFYGAEQERMALEMGASEDGFLGYDFSNGYTSLEASSPRPARRGSFWKRLSRKLSSWRADRQARREKDEEVEVKQRVDSLLEKIAKEGMTSLSEKEREFLKDASKYYHM